MNRSQIENLIDQNLPSVNIVPIQQWEDEWEVYLVLHGTYKFSSVTVRNPKHQFIGLDAGGGVRYMKYQVPYTPVWLTKEEDQEMVWEGVPEEVRKIGERALDALQRYLKFTMGVEL